jgi:hypothetical protein
MTFNIGDRVKITRSQRHSQYKEGFIGTVTKLYSNHDNIGVVTDNDPDFGNPYPVPTSDIIHVTNVPSVRPRGSDVQPQTTAGARTFGTGATRDLDANKLDFEGFLSPLVLERYAEHMHKARKMPDGTMRESDNWQLGIPVDVYMKSMWRHFFAVWKLHRGLKVTEVVNGVEIVKDLETELCALKFNVSGMLHETLKPKKPQTMADLIDAGKL